MSVPSSCLSLTYSLLPSSFSTPSSLSSKAPSLSLCNTFSLSPVTLFGPPIHSNPSFNTLLEMLSLAIGVSDSDMNILLDKSPSDSSISRAFMPNLNFSDSFASVLSLQITLFPNSGFSIGISSHHAGLDGKSSTMFIKAWAYLCLCQTDAENESSGLLPQELQPFLDREVVIDSRGIAAAYIKGWSDLDPTQNHQKIQPNLKILSEMFQPKVEDTARATFELKRGDLNKIKERVLQKWENHKEEDEREESTISKPQTSSTFVLTTAYVLVCFAKAMERTGENKTRKLLFAFTADCRARLDPPIPENYFGNCVMPQIIETQQEDLTEDDGIVIVAKKIHRKISKIQKEKGEVLDGAETLFTKHYNQALAIGVAGSTQFGVYQADFGWGRPEKVEMTSVDRGISMAMAESKDGNGGVEVGIALKNQAMDQFASLFQTEMESF